MVTPIERTLQQAVGLHQAGRVADAAALYAQVVRQAPQAVGALNLLGIAEFQLGRLPQAAKALRRALKLNPALPNGDYNLARVLQGLGEYQDALAHYRKAAAAAPGDAEVASNLGTVLAALGRGEEAIAAYRRAVTLKPDYADAWFNLGNALESDNRYADAAEAFGRAIALRPDHAGAQGGLGLALNALNRHDEAIAHLQRALALDPGAVAAHVNLANALAALDRDDEAMASYDRALALSPQHADALWNKALLYLSRGRFAEGWPNFQHRWTMVTANPRRPYRQPAWTGEPVAGTLLLWGEQGLGDQLMLSSMVAEARGRAGHVVLEVEPRLVSLLARSLPGIEVIPQGEKLARGSFTAQAPLGDLGRMLRPDWAAFAAAAPGYLRVDRARADTLRARLAGDGRRVIGLSWVSKNKALGNSKSAQLADLLAVLRLPNARFIDLQYGDTAAERAAIEREHGIAVERLPDIDTMNDIDGLAALIAACDAVVTVSNTTAHLAAGQGRPTYIMLPAAHGRLWYWQRSGPTPWYASARLIRQRRGQSWAAVAEELAGQLLRELG